MTTRPGPRNVPGPKRRHAREHPASTPRQRPQLRPAEPRLITIKPAPPGVRHLMLKPLDRRDKHRGGIGRDTVPALDSRAGIGVRGFLGRLKPLKRVLAALGVAPVHHPSRFAGGHCWPRTATISPGSARCLNTWIGWTFAPREVSSPPKPGQSRLARAWRVFAERPGARCPRCALAGERRPLSGSRWPQAPGRRRGDLRAAADGRLSSGRIEDWT